MKKTTLLLSSLLMTTAVIRAQSINPRSSTIGASIGWQQLKFVDDNASPLMYKATSFPTAGLNYTHVNARSYFKMQLSGGTGNANPAKFGARDYMTRFNDKDSFQYQISSMFVHANLEATYLRKLNPSSTGSLGYWAGGTISDQAYYADEVANNPWLINTAELSPALKVDYQNSLKHNFSVKVNFAGLALITRSVYGLFAKSNKDNNVAAYLKQGTRLTSVHEYQKVNVEFNYGYHVSNRIAVGGTYAFRWLHYTHPMPMRAIDSRFNLNIDYSLHK